MAATDPDQLTDSLNLVNAGYVADLYERYRTDPASVDEEWRARFDGGFAGFAPVTVAAPPAAPSTNGRTEAARAAEPASPPTAAAEAKPLPTGATPIKGPAARLATNMIASLAIPTATSFRDMAVSTLEERRRELNEQVQPRKVSFTHLIGFAIVQAARALPSMTHYYLEADSAAYRVDPGGVNLGLAVDVERPDGSRFLVVPVIKGADAMDFAAFLARYEELVAKARTNKLGPDDMAGATITLTNPGTLGTTASVPRLMPNTGCIVATGSIRGVGGQRLMTISSTYDHRIIQGAESGSFLRAIDASLRGEDTFYADVFGAVHATLAPEVPAPPATAAGMGSGAPAGYDDLKAVAAGMALVKAYRNFGHKAARLDPLGTRAARRPGARPGAARPERDEHGPHPRGADADLRPRRHAGGGAASPRCHVLRHDRVRGRARRQPRGARLAAPRRSSRASMRRRSTPRRSATCSPASPGSRGSSASSTRRTWGRSASASRGSTRWSRCSTASSRTPPTPARARS